jgi:hypothetical protein
MVSCAGSDTFLAKVFILQLPFRPDVYGANYHPPVSGGKIHNPNILADLTGAFCSANFMVQRDLLSLNAIYINPCADTTSCDRGNPITCDPDACNIPDQQVIDNSWGFRERRDQYRPGQTVSGRYIATSAGLWRNGQPAPPLHEYETKLLSQLLSWNDPNPTIPAAPQYTINTSPDTSAMTVLSALAHELGHVRWYDTFVWPPGSGHLDLSKLCGARFFQSWQGPWQRLRGPPPWRNFQSRSERATHPILDKHATGVQISDIDTAVQAGAYPLAGSLVGPGGSVPPGTFVTGIYAPSAPWASFFGAVSPDEDFVETYKFYALTQASPGLQSLPVQIPYVANTLDIPSDYRAGWKPELSIKTDQCIAHLPPPPAAPAVRSAPR